MGFRVQGSGFRGCRVLGFRVLGFRVYGFRFWGFLVLGLGFSVGIAVGMMILRGISKSAPPLCLAMPGTSLHPKLKLSICCTTRLHTTPQDSRKLELKVLVVKFGGRVAQEGG